MQVNIDDVVAGSQFTVSDGNGNYFMILGPIGGVAQFTLPVQTPALLLTGVQPPTPPAGAMLYLSGSSLKIGFPDGSSKTVQAS